MHRNKQTKCSDDGWNVQLECHPEFAFILQSLLLLRKAYGLSNTGESDVLRHHWNRNQTTVIKRIQLVFISVSVFFYLYNHHLCDFFFQLWYNVGNSILHKTLFFSKKSWMPKCRKFTSHFLKIWIIMKILK